MNIVVFVCTVLLCSVPKCLCLCEETKKKNRGGKFLTTVVQPIGAQLRPGGRFFVESDVPRSDFKRDVFIGTARQLTKHLRVHTED